MRAREATAFENEYFLKEGLNGSLRLCVRKVKKGTSIATKSADAFRMA